MYEAHDLFLQPESEDVRVWRYMDFTKLVSLIDSRCLYFARADKLGDPFEGSWPKMNVVAREAEYQHLLSRLLPEHLPIYKEGIDSLKRYRRWRHCYAINCWHMNEHESAAMWNIYLKSDTGIAIQSTYKKLRDAIIADERVYLGLVNYIDYEHEQIEVADNYFSPFLFKRKSFEHEKEVRALIERSPTEWNDIDGYQDTIANGVKIGVDIEMLIENIYVSPSAPEWFSELVRTVVDRYGCNFNVKQSKLDEQALF